MQPRDHRHSPPPAGDDSSASGVIKLRDADGTDVTKRFEGACLAERDIIEYRLQSPPRKHRSLNSLFTPEPSKGKIKLIPFGGSGCTTVL